jgi:predicted nucleic acid-binding Zn ribbon protein
LRRLFGTGAALLFKGSGFYKTDYRSESYKMGAEAEKKPADTSSGSDKTSKSSDHGSTDAKTGSKTKAKASAGAKD